MAFYTEPRWEEAPEGTTGFLPETENYWASWVKKVDDAVYTANASHRDNIFYPEDVTKQSTWTTRKNTYIPRPEEQKQIEPNWDEAPLAPVTEEFFPNHDWTAL